MDLDVQYVFFFSRSKHSMIFSWSNFVFSPNQNPIMFYFSSLFGITNMKYTMTYCLPIHCKIIKNKFQSTWHKYCNILLAHFDLFILESHFWILAKHFTTKHFNDFFWCFITSNQFCQIIKICFASITIPTYFCWLELGVGQVMPRLV